LRLASEYRFEVILCLMLLATLAAVRFQEPLLSRSIMIEPRDAKIYAPRFYGDQPLGGSSDIQIDPRRAMQWRCTLRAKYTYPYCGYELLFDARTPERGLNLSRYDSVTVDLDYRGPSDTFRIYIKNFDPRYSKPGIPDTLKFNKVEVAAKHGRDVVTLKLSDFGVAEWWVTQNKIRPALSVTQFDNVTEFEFQTGTLAPPGTYVFRVHRITLHGRLVSQAAWYASILAVWAAMIGLYLIYRIVRLRRDLEQRRRSQAAALRLARFAEESARHDYLTRLLNRAGITELYHRMAMDRQRKGSFAAILLDIDHFKEVNDRFGHKTGDKVLTEIAAILNENMRASDIVGRWGGEEFLLVCGVEDEKDAERVAAKLREAIQAHDFSGVGHLTASFGVYHGREQMESLDWVTSRADAALYQAKEQGRNCVVLCCPPQSEAA